MCTDPAKEISLDIIVAALISHVDLPGSIVSFLGEGVPPCSHWARPNLISYK